MKKQNSNQNVKDERMVVFVKTFDHHEFNFDNFLITNFDNLVKL